MKNKYLITFALIAIVFSFAATGSAEGQMENPKLLVIDESKSFEISMRVQGLVSAIKNREDLNLEIEAKMIRVNSPTENPLKEKPEAQYDAVIIVPNTISSGRIEQIWIATRPFSKMPQALRAQARSMMTQMKKGIDQAFSGKAKAVGVNDDVIPAYFSTLFLREGILR